MKKDKLVVIAENRRAKRDDNVSIALYAIYACPQNVISLSKKLGVSRSTANSYVSELLESGFIRIGADRGQYRRSTSAIVLNNQCRGKNFRDMLEQGKKKAQERHAEILEQLSLWEDVIS